MGWARNVLGAVAAAMSIGPGLLGAQGTPWPTLADAGIEYLSPTGFVQLTLSGRLDLEAIHVGGDQWAGLVDHRGHAAPPGDWVPACADCHDTLRVDWKGKGGFIPAHRLRLFADLFVGDHVYGLVEARSDLGHEPRKGPPQVRLEQAFIRLASASGRVGVQVGQFANPFGSYPLRHLTAEDPFLRPPLAYDYLTVMSDALAPDGAAGFQSWKEWPELFRIPGVPPVWDVPYPWGAMVFGRAGPLELRAAAVNSSPSSDPDAWGFDVERLRHPSIVVGMGGSVTPSLRVGASYNRGPWMEALTGPLPPSTPGSGPPTFRDFDQEMFSADVQFARGRLTLRGEAILDLWEVPNLVERPKEVLYNGELQWSFGPRWSAATRIGHIDFRPSGQSSGGPEQDWDYDVSRVEAAVSYGWRANVGATISAYYQSAEDGAGTTFSGVRLWWAF